METEKPDKTAPIELKQPKKVVIATPHRHWFTPDYIGGLLRLATQDLRDTSIRLIANECGIISMERNICFLEARDMGADYLLFIDSDIIWPPEAWALLWGMQKDVATGLYVSRRYPYYPAVYNFGPKGEVWNFAEFPTEPFRCDAAGCGFMLISGKVLQAFTKEVIETMGKPFNLMSLKSGEMDKYFGEQLGEDIAFCHRIKQLGFELWGHPLVRLEHVGFHHYKLDHFFAYKKQIAEQTKDRKATDETTDSNATREQPVS